MTEGEALLADLQEAVRQMRLCKGELIAHTDVLRAREAGYHERIDATERALRLLAEDWRKQRAVNEAYRKWIVESAANQGVTINVNENLQAVVRALTEALNP